MEGTEEIMSNANLVMEATTVNIADIQPDPENFRKTFNDDRQKELVASIKQTGLLNPLIVRRTGTKVPFEIVAGERRYRALKELKIDAVPVRITPSNVTPEGLDVARLVDNIEREDLTTFETASAFGKLAEKYSLSGSDIAKKTGKSVSYINKLLKPWSQLDREVAKDWAAGHPLATVDNLNRLVSKYGADDMREAWENLKMYGAFEAPEDGEEGEEGEGKGKPNGEAKTPWKPKSVEVRDRYGICVKSLESDKKYDGAWVLTLLKYLVGKRVAPPEGVELPTEEKGKGAGKRKAREV